MDFSFLLKQHNKILDSQLEQAKERIKIHRITGDTLAQTLENVQQKTIENYILKKFNRIFYEEKEYGESNQITKYIQELKQAKNLNKYPPCINEILKQTPQSTHKQVKQKYINTLNNTIIDITQKLTPHLNKKYEEF
ncbi:MAG: hypothetical protein ACLFN8_04905 [Candidatus Woesearchaeota archaeon]